MHRGKSTLIAVRHILAQLVRAQKAGTKEVAEPLFETALANARSILREDLAEAISHVRVRTLHERRALALLLCEFADVPGVVDMLRTELKNPDSETRRWIIECIGDRKLVPLATLLNDAILYDCDLWCRAAAIRAAGKLRQDVNLAVLLSVVGKPDVDEDVISALRDYAVEECRPHLRAAFDRSLGPPPDQRVLAGVNNPRLLRLVAEYRAKKFTKLMAAWGLARLGELDGIRFLGELLYDPPIRLKNVSDPGESLRAAQALADVFGLPFQWTTDSVNEFQKWWEASREHILSGTPTLHHGDAKTSGTP